MLREQLHTALKEGLKRKDSCTVTTVRLILAAIKERDIAARGKGGEDPVDDDIIRELLQTMIKQRRESIDMYQKGGRQDLADREAREIDVPYFEGLALYELILCPAVSEAESRSYYKTARELFWRIGSAYYTERLDTYRKSQLGGR